MSRSKSLGSLSLKLQLKYQGTIPCMELTVSCLPEMATVNTLTVLDAISEAKNDLRKHRTIWIGHVAGCGRKHLALLVVASTCKRCSSIFNGQHYNLFDLAKKLFLLGAKINHLTR